MPTGSLGHNGNGLDRNRGTAPNYEGQWVIESTPHFVETRDRECICGHGELRPRCCFLVVCTRDGSTCSLTLNLRGFRSPSG